LIFIIWGGEEKERGNVVRLGGFELPTNGFEVGKMIYRGVFLKLNSYFYVFTVKTILSVKYCLVLSLVFSSVSNLLAKNALNLQAGLGVDSISSTLLYT
jgi:hypothetical protein